MPSGSEVDGTAAGLASGGPSLAAACLGFVGSTVGLTVLMVLLGA